MLQKLFFTFYATFLFVNFGFAQEKTPKTQPIIIGESITFSSAILEEERTLNVYLPESYQEETSKTYPVIYLLDGSLNEDFIHIVGLIQFASFSWIQIVPESIVVGISNVDRKRDFTYPTSNKKDKEDFPTTGESANFIRFLEKEVQPMIANKYRTSTEKTIIGQSLGGLLATEILLKKPAMFNNYIIVSPSLWWDDASLLQMQPEKIQQKKKIFVAVGKEGEIMERVAKELYEKLQQCPEKNYDLYFKFLEKQRHGDALHLAVYHALEAFAPKKK